MLTAASTLPIKPVVGAAGRCWRPSMSITGSSGLVAEIAPMPAQTSVSCGRLCRLNCTLPCAGNKRRNRYETEEYGACQMRNLMRDCLHRSSGDAFPPAFPAKLRKRLISPRCRQTDVNCRMDLFTATRIWAVLKYLNTLAHSESILS